MGTAEVLDVPPDGHCLFSCVVAARDVERLRTVNQDSWGFLRSQREDRELRTACRRLREMVGGLALEDGRVDVVEQLASAALPEGAVLTYVARWLGGTVLVTTEGAALPHWHRAVYRCICCAARARPPKKAHMMTEKNSDPKECCQASTSTRKTLQCEILQFSAASLWALASSRTRSDQPARPRSVADAPNGSQF